MESKITFRVKIGDEDTSIPNRATMKFDTHSEAFDYCREVGYPVIVTIKDKKWKLYPSGKAVEIR